MYYVNLIPTGPMLLFLERVAWMTPASAYSKRRKPMTTKEKGNGSKKETNK
jgi:hypothetical protein